MSKQFKVQQIDHVEVFVPDQYEAAQWYAEVLGLHVLPEHEHWAADGGPLMISSDGGQTMLALFNGEPQGSAAVVGLRRVAFRVDAAGFRQFLERVAAVPIFGETGERQTRQHVVDHEKAFSIYLSDPYGNPYEVTTYDYEAVASYLSA